IFGLYIAGGWLLPGRKRVVPYSIQWLKRMRPALFRHDLTVLFDLLRQQQIKPLIARRFALGEARRAHELLGEGGVTGKIGLVPRRGVGGGGSRVPTAPTGGRPSAPPMPNARQIRSARNVHAPRRRGADGKIR